MEYTREYTGIHSKSGTNTKYTGYTGIWAFAGIHSKSGTNTKYTGYTGICAFAELQAGSLQYN